MWDIALESIRAAVAVGILVFFVWFGRRGQLTSHRGWWFVVVGFGLVSLGSAVDITDNFESLNRYVLIGDTNTEAFVEKVIGFLAGFLALAIGFSLWLPRIEAVVASHGEIEGELEAAEVRFRSAFDHAPIAMLLTNPDGRFLQVNPAMCEMLKYSSEEFATLTWMDITHPDDLDESLHRQREQLVEGAAEFFVIEKRYTRSDGRIVFAQTSISVVRDSRSTPLHLIAQLVDMTEVRQVHQRLEELVRSKNEFIASVSHELRTPLTAVLGFAEMLQDEELVLSATDRNEMMQLIAHQAFDLSSIVEDLLVAARADIGTLSIIAVPVDLRAQTAQVIETYEKEAVAGVKVDGQSVQALGDPTRVRQILRNLFTNAVRYGGDDIRVNMRNEESSVLVLVSDDGPGIPAEHRDLIFEPYHRAYEVRGISGSVGLGLSVSRKLARLMGGVLAFQRKEGWSIFTLTLPGAPAYRSSDAPTEARASAV